MSTTRNNDLFQQFALANSENYAHAGRKAGKQALQYGPPDGPEFKRIVSLPRRDWRTAYDVQQLVKQYTSELLLSGGSGRLLPMQAIALHELKLYGRLYVVAGLGTGKTLLSALAPTVLGLTGDEVVYLPPAGLVDQTVHWLTEFRDIGWNVPEPKHVLSADEFAKRSHASYLLDIKPKLIVLDESQTFGNPDTGRSRRMQQYIDSGVQPDVRVITLTATPGDSSLNSIRHLLVWALGSELCPLPMDDKEFWIWCQALDYDPGFNSTTGDKRKRPPPGVLATLCPGGTDDLAAIREAVGLRIEQTPGCFYYRIDDTEAQLTINHVSFDSHAPAVLREYAAVRAGADCLSDGRVLDVPVLDSVLLQTLGLGFARVIDPPPPSDWRDARKEYNALVREVLSAHDGLGLHTPDQVNHAFRSGQLEDVSGSFSRWEEIRPAFRERKSVVWLDTAVLTFVANLAAAEHMIVWTLFPAFGEALSLLTGMPFFHQLGRDADGAHLQTAAGGRSVIASINANATGRNLQDRWHRNLVVGVPGKADLLQQLIGRTHRRGQPEPMVTVTVLMASVENAKSLYTARRRASYDRTMNRAIESRLLDCSWQVLPLSHFRRKSSPVWLAR